MNLSGLLEVNQHTDWTKQMRNRRELHELGFTEECYCISCVGQEEHERMQAIMLDMNLKYLKHTPNETQEEAQWRLHRYLTDPRRRVKVDCYCMHCKGEKKALSIALQNLRNTFMTKQLRNTFMTKQ